MPEMFEIRPLTFEELAQKIRSTPPSSVIGLDLSFNLLFLENLEQLAPLFKELPPGLTALNLSGNHLGLKDTEQLVALFKALPPGLTTLNLSLNQLGLKDTEELAALFKALPPGLTTLNLCGNQLGLKDTEELAVLFKALPRGLTTLNLCNMELKKTHRLSDAFREMPPCLNNLSLSMDEFFTFDQADIASVINALPHTTFHFSSMERLDISKLGTIQSLLELCLLDGARYISFNISVDLFKELLKQIDLNKEGKWVQIRKYLPLLLSNFNHLHRDLLDVDKTSFISLLEKVLGLLKETDLNLEREEKFLTPNIYLNLLFNLLLLSSNFHSAYLKLPGSNNDFILLLSKLLDFYVVAKDQDDCLIDKRSIKKCLDLISKIPGEDVLRVITPLLELELPNLFFDAVVKSDLSDAVVRQGLYNLLTNSFSVSGDQVLPDEVWFKNRDNVESTWSHSRQKEEETSHALLRPLKQYP